MHASVRACVPDVFAIYDNNISPRLIMIIIKIYFIQIRHTDDFPSTGSEPTCIPVYSLVDDKLFAEYGTTSNNNRHWDIHASDVI